MTAAFDQVIVFEREVRTPDEHGGAAVTWEEVFTARAIISPVQGRELLNSQALEQITTHRIYIRHHNGQDVDTSMRIVWTTNGGKILNIVSCPDPGPRALVREVIGQEGGAV